MKTKRTVSLLLSAAFGMLLWHAPASAEDKPEAPKQGEAAKKKADKKGAKKHDEKKEEDEKPAEKPEDQP